jgi:uncharacterized protein YkwD/Ca2+-binding RTX toxin-like protein
MADMTPQEQLMLELINRARMDPNGEAARYGITLNEGLADGTISSAPKQVLAGSDTLDAAADSHSQWMLAHNIFAHEENGGGTGTNPNDRMTAAGYGPINWWGENISASGRSEAITDALATQLIEEQHESLFVDTDVDSRGHRLNILNDNFKEVGIGQQIGSFTFDSGTYNTSMVTQDFGKSGSGLFITGVVYNDTVINDDFFSVGEQVTNIGVSSAGATTDQTGAGGGYELLYGNGGAESVAFALASGTITVDLTLGATNAKVDVVNGSEVWSNTSITSVSSNVSELHALGIGNVELDAAGGDQRLYGNSGNNILDGGDGADVAVYDGAFANFSITKNGDGSYQVRDMVGSQGTDTISNIESLQFSDRLYTFANSAPILNGAIADQQAISGSAFSLDVPAGLFTDPDGDKLSYTAEAAGGGALPGWLTFDANTMTFSGTPDKADAGTVSIRLIASDGAHSTADTFDLAVQAANVAPEAVDDSATMQENNIALIDVTQNDSDPDGDAISISRLVSHSDNVAVSIVDGKIQVEYTGPDIAFGATGQANVVYEIKDSHGNADTATLAVAVADSDGAPNSPPVANDDLVNLAAGVKTALVDVISNDSDPDNDPFGVTSIVSVSGNAHATIENGEIRVNYTGPDLGVGATSEMDVVYEITDSHGKTDTATLAVTLKGSDIVPNSPPVANDDVANLDAGVKTALVDVTSNDLDPDHDSFNISSIVSVSGNAEATIENGQIRVNYIGPDLGAGATDKVHLVYQITDENGATDTATLTVNLKGAEQIGQDIIGSNKGEELQGTESGEYIAGRRGADDLFGNGGNDILDGGRGADDLYGGAGADVFIFAAQSGHDNIYDFSHAEGDKIDLSGVKGISGYQDLIRNHISFDQFEGVLISVNHGNDLWVEDMDGRHMHKSDFIF